ncbi:hypothetical protein [Novosphingobium sp. B1]|uniref:DUF7940 domain-containing protein n=1 Tax=Novosphingobium sp. B1 TaxID=1938756 RepID=UPI0009D7CB2D|nr:hypothetical protein [Novosphingobium sp. B1]SMD05630.1 hypothetical protein SAMN06272759_1305 [Novosphingobium sp. B1]
MNLIEDWAEKVWKLWSVRLAAIAGIVAGYFAAYPSELQKLVEMVPEAYRPVASILIGVFVFTTATGSRLVKQGTPPCLPEEDE